MRSVEQPSRNIYKLCRRRRLSLVSEHRIGLLSALCHLWLMTMANVTLKAQHVME